MAIWFTPLTPDDLNHRGKNTMAEFLEIKFIDVGEDTLTASMPATVRTKQPIGIIHGGANVVLAETLASTAANAVVDLEKFYCVGLEINANHVRSVQNGGVTGITKPVHIGRSTQIWSIEIFDEDGRLTCISRMTAAVLSRKA